MKILFDHQIFTEQKYGGISRYFANLYEGINAQPGMESKLGLLFTNNAYLKNLQLPAGFLNGYIQKESRRIKYNKWYSKYLLNQNNFDVFHPTYYNPYFLKSLKKPFVLTVHDMIHELFPQYFDVALDPKIYKGKAIEQADHIIAISESTKRDILKFYDVREHKISVIHHGFKMQVEENVKNDITIESNYILFVGDRGGYKNFELFIRAAASIILKHSIKLICAGGGVFKAEEIKILNELNVVNNVQQLNATDEQLRNLYRNALAFVYPSLYEGFGLPILEAFFNSCPVILSNTSSLPEVAGDAAQYFDPNDEQTITNAIEQVITDKSRRNELKTKGVERLKQFSFESCLQKTIQVYKSLS
ncbi:MAG TPA: glycosyltransferase family 1 protein [Mucilaginibacter sp.]|jgi:glycosyltransferase involved in cell wall biosynthesis